MSAADAITIFNAGVNAVKPAVLMHQHLQVSGDTLLAGNKYFKLNELDGIYVLAIGKAASAMAAEAEDVLGSKIKQGLVVTKYSHSLPLRYCDTIEAGHPVPDDNSVAAAVAIRKFLQQLTQNSLLLCCISGGASALLADVADGITLEELQQLSTLLLQCGAYIQEINTVRKHICDLKGGQLLRYANGAAVTSLIISDVVGDDISVIASGLTAADASTFSESLNILDKYGLRDKIPASILSRIMGGVDGLAGETPKPCDPIFKRVDNVITGSNNTALAAAAVQASHLGYHVQIVNSQLQGDAEEEAKKFAQLLLEYKGRRPACLLMGGETTVTVSGTGKGGRNQQFVLAAVCEMEQQNLSAATMPVILSGGTDGTDGPTDAAGACTSADAIAAMRGLQLTPGNYLRNNDAYHFFKQTGGLIFTGPTQTNVMDIIIGLIW